MTDLNRLLASQVNMAELQLGVTDLEYELETQHEARTAAQALAAQAQHTLLLHTENLEPAVYDDSVFLEAISRLARAHGHARIWILVQDSRKAVLHGHRLIEVARRLSSSIQLRRPAPQYLGFHEALLLADGCGYLHRPIAGRFEGTVNFHDPGKVADWGKYFMEVWERSEPDAELRHLHL